MLLIYYVHEGNLYIPGNTDNKKKKKAFTATAENVSIWVGS